MDSLQEKDFVSSLAREGNRLGLIFNGMQKRGELKPPLALFTDRLTKTTFGVEPGQNVRSQLIETRKRFHSF